MAPKKRVKRKVQAAAQASANTRKKQRVSLDSVESLPTDSEIAPSSIGSLLEGETPATDGGSVAGPSSGLEGASIAGPSYSGEKPGVSGPSARVVGASIASPSSHSAEEAGVSSESVPGATGIEGDSVAESSPNSLSLSSS